MPLFLSKRGPSSLEEGCKYIEVKWKENIMELNSYKGAYYQEQNGLDIHQGTMEVPESKAINQQD